MILENPKRLGIFFFYDAQGHADHYVSTLLDGFKPFFNELAIVVNGKIDESSKAMLKGYANKFILRENRVLTCGRTKLQWTLTVGQSWKSLTK